MTSSTPLFQGFDFHDFWEQSTYVTENCVEPKPTAQLVAELEEELGYKLPAAYLALAQIQNGGSPRNPAHRTSEPTSWASDHVAVTTIFSIGRDKRYSLGGDAGSQFWIDEWEYPDIGVYFADCPSGGHDMFCLDYRACGPTGEPSVVHVDQERDYKITFVAANFEAFIRGLQSSDDFEI